MIPTNDLAVPVESAHADTVNEHQSRLVVAFSVFICVHPWFSIQGQCPTDAAPRSPTWSKLSKRS